MVLHSLQVEHAYLLLVYTLLTIGNARLQKGLPGVKLFVLYNALALVGALAVVWRGQIPDFVSIVLGNISVVAAYTALYGSLHCLFGFSRRQHLLSVGWLSLGVIADLWFGAVQPDTATRLFFFSGVLALQQFQMAALLLLRSGSGRRLAWMSGTFLVAMGLANTFRMATVVSQGVPTDYRAAGPALAAIVLANACLQCGLMVSYVWLTAARLRRDLEHQANTDPLTGLLNRRALEGFAERQLGTSLPGHVSALLLDLDNYKPINDQLGHAAGDRALVAVAAMLSREVRRGIYVARTGGDEFMALLPRTNLDEASLLAERLRAVLQDLDLDLDSTDLRVTGSFGVAEAQLGESWDSLCSRCDRALYTAKRQGGNAVHSFRLAAPETIDELFVAIP